MTGSRLATERSLFILFFFSWFTVASWCERMRSLVIPISCGFLNHYWTTCKCSRYFHSFHNIFFKSCKSSLPESWDPGIDAWVLFVGAAHAPWHHSDDEVFIVAQEHQRATTVTLGTVTRFDTWARVFGWYNDELFKKIYWHDITLFEQMTKRSHHTWQASVPRPLAHSTFLCTCSFS